MASNKKVTEIVQKLRAQFSSFGGGICNTDNPISIALEKARPQFAAGVDIEEVVRSVIAEVKR